MGKEPEKIRQDIAHRWARIDETAEALASKADVPSRAKEKVRDKFDGAVSRVSGVLPDGGQVTGDVAGKARRAGGITRDNPLGLAVGAAAAGFLAGLLLPSSRVEDEKLGPYADEVKDQALETGQEALTRGRKVAAQAAESAKETAEESGRRQARKLTNSAKSRVGTGGS